MRAAFVVALAAVAPAAASAAPPRVAQLVVYRNGEAKQQLVTAAGAKAQVGSKRCSIGAATPLAALLHSGLPGIRLKDYGSCSSKPADAGGLYVRRIRKDVAKGANGWVYKVGNKVGTTGAADASGPFGSGRIKTGARITWLYCHMRANGCQRTLAIKPDPIGGGRLRVIVKAYNDFGRARAAAGATVLAGSVKGTADSQGIATLQLEPGQTSVYAKAKGTVRSFAQVVEVR